MPEWAPRGPKEVSLRPAGGYQKAPRKCRGKTPTRPRAPWNPRRGACGRPPGDLPGCFTSPHDAPRRPGGLLEATRRPSGGGPNLGGAPDSQCAPCVPHPRSHSRGPRCGAAAAPPPCGLGPPGPPRLSGEAGLVAPWTWSRSTPTTSTYGGTWAASRSTGTTRRTPSPGAARPRCHGGAGWMRRLGRSRATVGRTRAKSELGPMR